MEDEEYQLTAAAEEASRMAGTLLLKINRLLSGFSAMTS